MDSENTRADKLWEKVPRDLLQSEFLEIVQDIPQLGVVAKKKGNLSQHLFDKLSIALEMAVSCVFLGRMGMIHPLVTLTRSIFESMISIYWATLSEENLLVIVEAEKQEMTRLMRNNLVNGWAVVLNKETGAVENKKILDNPEVKRAQRPPQVAKMAEASGMKKIYDMFYGSLSLFAHGHAVNLISGDLYNCPRDGTDDLTTAILPLMRGCLKSIRLITVNYIRNDRQTEIEELEAILGAKLSS